MKKIPLQFTVDALSLSGVLLFVFWTSHGGLKAEISSLFHRQGTSENLRDQVGHIGDILYFCSEFVAAITVILAILHLSARHFSKLTSFLPTFEQTLGLFLDLVHHLIIFVCIYTFLLHKDGGLKRQKQLLFPFWYLITIALDVVGKAISAVQSQVNISGAGLYLRVLIFGLMIAQIGGYTPFKLF